MEKFLARHASHLAWAALLLFMFVVLKNAWISDDAYISFRSIEQFYAGNGLRWNYDERVQVYTSPLWFFCKLWKSFSHCVKSV